MDFTYKIEGYYPYEARVFVVYTPVDAQYEQLGAWVSVTPTMTETEINTAVVAAAPIDKWTMSQSSAVQSLIGAESTGTATAPAPFVPPTPTAEQIAAMITAQAQQRLDEFAQTRRYASIGSLASYAGDADAQLNQEGTYGAMVRSQTWRAMRDFEAEVLAGTKPMPTSIDDVLPVLPVLAWPV